MRRPPFEAGRRVFRRRRSHLVGMGAGTGLQFHSPGPLSAQRIDNPDGRPHGPAGVVEVPVYWNIAWDNASTLENAEAQMRDMIARDHNRAAVILWSLSNETPIGPGRTEFLRSLAAYARQLDSTRLITSALNHTESPTPGTRLLNDPLGEYLDVLGLNEYVGWYEGRTEDADHLQWDDRL